MTGQQEDHSHVVPRLPTYGAAPPPSQYASMICTGTFKSRNISININTKILIHILEKTYQSNAGKPLFFMTELIGIYCVTVFTI
jgi:hypothetical protein